MPMLESVTNGSRTPIPTQQALIVPQDKRPRIVKAPLTITNGTSSELETIPLNRTGRLKAVNVTPTEFIGPFADMPIKVEISYRGQKTQVVIIDGYLKTSDSLFWNGDVLVDTETDLILEYLNTSGESQIIELTAVIENV